MKRLLLLSALAIMPLAACAPKEEAPAPAPAEAPADGAAPAATPAEAAPSH